MLIPEEQWRAQRRRHLSLLRLPENPKEYLASLVVAAKEGMDAVSRALARGDLSVDKGCHCAHHFGAVQCKVRMDVGTAGTV